LDRFANRKKEKGPLPIPLRLIDAVLSFFDALPFFGLALSLFVSVSLCIHGHDGLIQIPNRLGFKLPRRNLQVSRRFDQGEPFRRFVAESVTINQPSRQATLVVSFGRASS
jgi:hypothetical protein